MGDYMKEMLKKMSVGEMIKLDEDDEQSKALT
jgi:TusA-related sulfurtransferase